MAQHSIQATVVAESILTEGTLVVVGFTDGTCKSYRLSYNAPELPPRAWRWLTEEQLLAQFQLHNQDCAMKARNNLHEDKVRRLGWDYAKRGY